ncbi:YkgJ family cysteine cluster protein [Anatilimnocola floriformis]|uniref:YkgJ family cysteine cluster protein n=1 Tax=Anatilimnocola floriformis TaxID=2948575 RepID=UPI0020C2C11D|nr:YkgJ family cysteine cluster protein [Anatilimnocola floriformis]
MELPVIRTAGEEHWDCQSCGVCCRGSLILLSEQDLHKLREQQWENDPEFQGKKLLLRDARAGSGQRLAQQADGSCVFLTAAGRCRVHEKFGAESKPLVCRVFPLQLVPREKQAILTLRRACPSAALDTGRELNEHLPEIKRLVAAGELEISLPTAETTAQPAWQQANRVMAAAARIFGDERFPPVRRVVHALLFARLLDRARTSQLDTAKFSELITLLESGVAAEASSYFSDRRPPSALGGLLFRLTAAEYVRLHPDYLPPGGVFARLKLFRASVRMLRGHGELPTLHSNFPRTTFAALNEPLATTNPALLSTDIQQPLARYLATSAASYQYALAGRKHWSIVQSIRALALTFPMAMYLLRWATAGREPTRDDVARIVTALDRGQGFSSLSGPRYRMVLGLLDFQNDLERIAVWYAR